MLVYMHALCIFHLFYSDICNSEKTRFAHQIGCQPNGRKQQFIGCQKTHKLQSKINKINNFNNLFGRICACFVDISRVLKVVAEIVKNDKSESSSENVLPAQEIHSIAKTSNV